MMELLGPPEEPSTVVETTRFAAKRHNDLLWFEQNEIWYPSVFDSTVLLLVSHVLFTLYFACLLKHSQFLHEVAVETHPCSDTW